MAKNYLFVIGIIVVLCLMCLAKKSEAEKEEYMKYKDPNQPINQRINDLMTKMTLEEKIGQMTQIDREVASTQVMKKYHIGIVFIYIYIYI